MRGQEEALTLSGQGDDRHHASWMEQDKVTTVSAQELPRVGTGGKGAAAFASFQRMEGTGNS